MDALILVIITLGAILFLYRPSTVFESSQSDKLKNSKKKSVKNKSSSSSFNYGYGILRFVVVAVILGIGRELELDKQLGGLLTALITLSAFVWVFRGNRLFTYRPGQNLWESKEKNKPKESTSVRKKEYTPSTLEDISKEKATKEIKELKELLDSGIISKTEYNNKAKELKKIILK